MECEGMCYKHKGEIKLVEVFDKYNEKSWGKFYYCDNAINIDMKNGFVVKIVDNENSKTV